MLLKVVFVLISLSAVTVRGQLTDHCTVMPSGSTQDGGKVTVPADCMNGSIWWNYPSGTLEVHFRQHDLFTVCLDPVVGPHLQALTEVVDREGIRKEIAMNPDKLACTPEAGNDVTLLMKQPSFQTYMTQYSFKILFSSF